MTIIFDVESDNKDPYEAQNIWCICTIDLTTGSRFSFSNYNVINNLQGNIDDALNYLYHQEEISCHNVLRYDLPLLKSLKGWEPNPRTKVTDTLILSKLYRFDIPMVHGCGSGPHSVEAWGIRFDRHKPGHEDWTKCSPEMIHRCKEDVEIQAMIYLYCRREMAKAGQWEFSEWLEHEFEKLLEKQNRRGWHFNSALALTRVQELEVLMQELRDKIQPYLPRIVKDEKELKQPLLKDGGWRKPCKEWLQACYGQCNPVDDNRTNFNGRVYNWSISGPLCRVDFPFLNLGSSVQLKPWLLSLGWRPTEWNRHPKTKKNTSPKLTEDSFDSIPGTLGADISLFLKYRHRQNTIKGWVNAVRMDGTVPAPSKGLGAATGRQTHKVIVNVPGEDAVYGLELRELFLATPGYKMVGGDSRSCQARALCHYLPEEIEFINAVINGKKEDGTDIHGHNMKLIGTDLKRVAKIFFYAWIFGATPKGLSFQIGCSEKEAAEYEKRYLQRLPGLARLTAELEEFWRVHGYVIGIDGRIVRIKKKKDILAYLLQLLEAISMKLTAIMVDQWAGSEGLDFHMLIHYHDEIEYDVKPEHVERFCEIFLTCIRESGRIMKLNVPLDGDIKVGLNWKQVH